MHHNNPSYEDLLKENARLKKLLAELNSNLSDSEQTKLNARLNEYIEELSQTFETVKEQKEELEKQKEKFQLLEQNISDIIWMMDLNGNFTYISPSASKVFEYSPQEFSKLHVSDVLTEGSYRSHKAMYTNRLEKENSGELTGNTSVELLHVKKDGKVFWAEVSSNPLRDSQNRLIGLVGVTRDISDRINTEDEIKKLSVAVEQNPASIVITDVNGRIEYVNSTFCQVTGYSFEEAVGENPRILKSGLTSPELYDDLWR